MKRGLLFFVSVLMALVLGACSDSTSRQENSYTVEKAVKDGHVVVENLSNQYNEITGGAIKTHNLKKIFAFKKQAAEHKKDQIKITIFNKNGSNQTSTLKYDGEKIVFINHYGGYQMPTGTFRCDLLSLIHGTAVVQACKGEDGKKYPSIVVLFGEYEKFREFR